MVHHFETKQELFGEDKVARDITLDDFDKDDMACIKAGGYQILPVRDRAGRCIFVTVFYQQKYKRPENMVRCLSTRPMSLSQ